MSGMLRGQRYLGVDMNFCENDKHKFKKRILWSVEKVKILGENKEPASIPISFKKEVVCIKCGVPKEIFEDKKEYIIWKADRRASEWSENMIDRFCNEWDLI